MSRILIPVLLILAAPMQARTRAVAGPPLLPRVKHIFMVVLENEDISAPPQPFLTELASKGALLTNYHALTHPSQPNYIALTAGSAYGITDDNPVTINVRNLADLIEKAGLTWKVYAEDYPGDCFVGASADGGLYVRRHVPFLEFADIQTNSQRCTNIVDATQLDADIASDSLPSFALYIPNNRHNGHDTSLAAADQFLQSRFGPLIDNPAFTSNTLFVVTFDESNSTTNNHVSTIFVGDHVITGAQSADWYDHYSLLKTIEATLGVGYLGKQDVTADVITGIWK
ncbi:MAG TPA: alkaline phosphatase family protein [Thermoanaerobaculia bacterium]